MRRVSAAAAAAIAVAAAAACSVLPGQAGGPLTYQHVWLIVLENHGYSQVIDASADPYINQLAQQYGLATNYFAVSHPSEPNYIALIGGSFFGIQDDDAFDSPGHTLESQSLASQLEAVGKTWKAYAQSLPTAGYTGTGFPRDGTELYASKHTPFLNFGAIQAAPSELQNIMPDTQLAIDLMDKAAPTFSLIIPDECHDMHGVQGVCERRATLFSWADGYVQSTVQAIQNSPAWRDGNTAIVVTWDEDDAGGDQGCCNAQPGGGHVATIVVTNNGPRAVRDDTPYNHYSLLATLQQLFGLGCLENTCDTANVTPMTPLFKV